ncbi:MAG: anthranilate phosphoribosyltransferase [bacterium]|nr:anthranilate phosphoribosyltransferase [bacterium]MDT8366414.1 anthranilate phosphoribosyltransferase [bacterium]
MLRESLNKVVEGQSLDAEAMTAAVGVIMEGQATGAQIGAFLTALRLKGETGEEIAGAVTALRDRSVKLPGIKDGKGNGLIDTCGTGGDGAGTVNVSTLAALTAAGAGARVAKHGNRSVSSLCGSADLLTALGVRIDVSPEVAARCLKEAGFAFLFAPLYHPAMKSVAPVRQEMGIRTLFNLIGPLCNPAGVKHQVMGVYSEDLVELIAGVLGKLGCERAMIVASKDGLDEISVCAPTTIAHLYQDGTIEVTTVDPDDLGIKTHQLDSLKGGEPEHNAVLSLELLKGAHGAVRDAVIVNAGAALVVSGKVPDMQEGMKMAKESIDSGRALNVLETVKGITASEGLT